MAAGRTLIIGAGPAGLAAARALTEQGLPYDHVERHSDVGGLWDIENPGTPMYESAHFISSRTMSGFPGCPMPEDYPDYPNHRQILAYLRSFAADASLTDRISFHTEVVAIDRGDDGTFSVTTRTADAAADPTEEVTE